ncbi:MAG: hypothetical protein KC416_00165 [Myxococcales bacterium]|nr:hypothetical protein [Myxococcales bacterium]
MPTRAEIAPNLARVSVLAFLVLFSYGFARSTIESLFLGAHGSEGLPGAWLLVAAVMTVVVMRHGRRAGVEDLGVLLARGCAWSAATLLAGILLHRFDVPYANYALYVWKDVHVVVLLETVWSLANVVFRTSTARWVYGLFCVFGSLGDFSGNLIVGRLAESLGTQALLWAPVPILGVTGALSLWFRRHATAIAPPPQKGKIDDPWVAFRVLRRSDYLPWLLGMILLVQIVITLIDYEYNAILESAFADQDERTRVIGDVYAAIAIGAAALQVLSGPVLRFLGVGSVLVGVPSLLGASLLLVIIHPAIAFAMATKVMSKTFDYSIFRVAKEMLYIPLDYEEKTRGKALVDMLTYRVAKGGASLLLLGLVSVGATALVAELAVVLTALWAFFAVVIYVRYRKRILSVPP